MLFIIALVTIALVRVNAGDSPVFSLKKKIQFPGSQEPNSFAIKSDDEILAAIYGEANTKSPKYTIFTGDQFEKTIRSYDYSNAPYSDISISDSGIQAAEGQAITKYPFRYQTEFKRNITQDASLITLDRKTWAYVAKNERNCPVIEVVSAYKESVKQVYFDTYANCSGKISGTLVDLKNGLIAFSSYVQYLHIVDKQALKNKLYVFPVQTIDIQSVFAKGFGRIGDVSSFYNSTTNESTIFLQDQSLANYYVLNFNKSNGEYFYQNISFYHPATKCQFYNENTCYGFLANYFVINQNVQNQMIAFSYDSNPFHKSIIIDVNQDQDLIATNMIDDKIVNIFKIDQNYQFSLFKTLNYSELIGSNVSLIKGEFTSITNQLILSFSIYESPYKSVFKICKWNPDSQKFPCIQNSGAQLLKGFALMKPSLNSSIHHLVVLRMKQYDNKFTLQAYSLTRDELTLATNFPFYIGFKILFVNFIYGKDWVKKFVLSVISAEDPFDCSDVHLYFQIILNSSKTNISFSHQQCASKYFQHINKVPYKDMMLMMVNINLSSNCEVIFYDINGDLIDFLPKIVYQNCYQGNLIYKLISQDSFDHFIVYKIGDINGAYVMDYYNITILDLSQKKYLFQKRSMFTNAYQSYSDEQNFVIFPLKQMHLSFWPYQTSGQHLIMYNISKIPLKIFKLQNINGKKFNFSIDKTNVSNNVLQFVYNMQGLRQQLYFTINESLYKIIDMNLLINAENYSQQVTLDNFTLYNKNQGQFVDVSRTLLASTGRHIISLLYTDVQFIAVFFIFLQNSVMWTLRNNTYAMNAVDISMEGLAFIIKPSLIRFEPFTCPNKLSFYKNDWAESTFKKTYAQNRDEWSFSTVKIPGEQQKYIALCNCLYGMYEPYPVIASKDQFEKVIGYVNHDLIVITVDSSNIEFFLNNNYIEEPLSKFNSTLVDIFLVTSPLSKSYQYHIHSNQQIMSHTIPNISDSIVVLKFSDYLITCYTNFSNCPGYLNVKANQIFAISQQTGLMAYVYPDSNQTETIHLIKAQPSSNTITSLQNLTLSKTKYVNGQVFSPKIKKLHFSSSGNLYVLAQDSSSNGFFAVLYSFTGGLCPKNMTVGKNYECECLENFTRSDFTSNTSQIVISEACKSCKKNFYYLDKDGKCICPSTFLYDENSGSCECLDGYIQGIDSESVCVHDSRSNNIWWIIAGCLGGLCVLPLIGFLVKRKCIDKQKFKKEKYLSARQSSNIGSENQSLQGSGLGESLTNSNRVSSNSRTQQRQNLRGSNSQSERESVRSRRFSESQSERSSRGQRRRESSSSGRSHRNLIRERSQESQYIIEPMLSNRQ